MGCEDSRRRTFRGSGRGRRGVVAASLALLLVDGFGTTVDTFAEAFIHVPAGRFMRGSDDSDPDARENEKPPHEVVLTHPFVIAATPVTQRLYEALMGKNPSRFTGAE